MRRSGWKTEKNYLYSWHSQTGKWLPHYSYLKNRQNTATAFRRWNYRSIQQENVPIIMKLWNGVKRHEILKIIRLTKGENQCGLNWYEKIYFILGFKSLYEKQGIIKNKTKKGLLCKWQNLPSPQWFWSLRIKSSWL